MKRTAIAIGMAVLACALPASAGAVGIPKVLGPARVVTITFKQHPRMKSQRLVAVTFKQHPRMKAQRLVGLALKQHPRMKSHRLVAVTFKQHPRMK